MDGFSKTYWNADQLLVWVWCRNRNLVHRAANGFTDYGSIVQELKQPDGRVVMAETQSGWGGLANLSLRAKVPPSRILDEVRTEVANVLAEGDRLHAQGLENGEGNLKEIEGRLWADLLFRTDSSDRHYASPDYWRTGAVEWHGLKFKRVEVLEIWPDPLENLPQVKTTQPLVPLLKKTLAAFLKRDTWTLTEALFLLNGNEPPGFETSDELTSHFHDAKILAVNSIQSGKLCREIYVAGERRFVESPARWFAWALEKGLPVAEAVRAKMMPAKSVDNKTNVPAQGTQGLATQSSPNGNRPEPTPGRRFSEAALREWYEQRVKDRAKDERPPSREEDLAAARREVSEGVPREAVRKLRAKFAPAEWKNQGRRKTGGK